MQPHSQQEEVLDSAVQYKVVSTGRRWGKRVLCEMAFYKQYTETRGQMLYVAPTFQMLREFISPIEQALPDDFYLFGISADDPERFKGQPDFDLLVVDEASFIQDFDWWPQFNLERTRVLVVGTPVIRKRGETDMLRELYGDAQGDVRWRAFTFSTVGNPYIAQGDLEEAKRTLSDDYWRTSFLGQFVSREA